MLAPYVKAVTVDAAGRLLDQHLLSLDDVLSRLLQIFRSLPEDIVHKYKYNDDGESLTLLTRLQDTIRHDDEKVKLKAALDDHVRTERSLQIEIMKIDRLDPATRPPDVRTKLFLLKNQLQTAQRHIKGLKEQLQGTDAQQKLKRKAEKELERKRLEALRDRDAQRHLGRMQEKQKRDMEVQAKLKKQEDAVLKKAASAEAERRYTSPAPLHVLRSFNNGTAWDSFDEDGNSLLHLACLAGSKRLIKLCLRYGMDINAVNTTGALTPLHTIIATTYSQRAELVDYMIDHGAWHECRDGRGLTPLLLASSLGHADCIRALLARAADREALTTAQQDAIGLATSLNQIEAVAALLEAGFNPNTIIDPDFVADGATLLHECAAHGYVEIARMLIARQAYVDAQDVDGNTPAIYAVFNQHSNVLTEILAAGAAPDIVNVATRSAMHWAIGHAEAIRLLAEADGDVNLRTKDSDTPLHLACASDDNIESTRVLLAYGASVDSKNSRGNQPAHVAARAGAAATMDLLIQYSTNMNARNFNNKNPLGEARMFNRMAVVAVIQRHYADDLKMLEDAGMDADLVDETGVVLPTKSHEDWQATLASSIRLSQLNEWTQCMLRSRIHKVSSETVASVAKYRAFWSDFTKDAQTLRLETQAAIKIQKRFRAYFYHKRFVELKLQHKMAIHLQRAYRGKLARRTAAHERHRHRCATKIEALVRGFLRQQMHYFGYTTQMLHAAITLQSMFRMRTARVYFHRLMQGVSICRSCEADYLNDPLNLTRLGNYVLYLHAIRHDYDRARPLYSRLMEYMTARGPDVPFILRCYALFLYVTEEEDVDNIAMLFERADAIDKPKKKFQLAFLGFFRYSQIMFPTNAQSNLNYAACVQWVYDQANPAKEHYLRALEADPYNKRILRLFNIFLARTNDAGDDGADHFMRYQAAMVQTEDAARRKEYTDMAAHEERHRAAVLLQTRFRARHERKRVMRMRSVLPVPHKASSPEELQLHQAFDIVAAKNKNPSILRVDQLADVYPLVGWSVQDAADDIAYATSHMEFQYPQSITWTRFIKWIQQASPPSQWETCGTDDANVYYYNVVSGVTQWEKPRIQRPVLAPLVDTWESAYTDQGDIYYYNAFTGESRWDNPQATPSHDAITSGWEEIVDDDGQRYYYNPSTGESAWEVPKSTTPGDEDQWEDATDGTTPYVVHKITGESLWTRPHDGWRAAVNAEGTVYYYSVQRNTSQWTSPWTTRGDTTLASPAAGDIDTNDSA
ncbi:hypothetical protein DYB32_003261 [Aphanomyces invadans]|uniref:WW domain-containing protein n=1 Tax=Aphanomyces invadans TaxID=157072 RepID=A0A3R6YBL8_9STRA|nr:hypothetical protein DYB32_003261 [Aphanomyces invadans]